MRATNILFPHPAGSGAQADETGPPGDVGQQLAWMRESGFVEVACTYRNLIFAVLSDTKPIETPQPPTGAAGS